LEESAGKDIGPNKLETTGAAIRYYYEMAGFSSNPIYHPWCARIMKTAKRLLVAKKLQRISISAVEMKSLLSHYLLHQDPWQIDIKPLMHLVVLLWGFLGTFVVFLGIFDV
jgi:hypothetical protein